MHLHYKWSQRDVTTPADAVALLDAQNIVMGVVIGTPAELALELARLAPQRVVAIYGPYRSGGDWHRWIHDESVVERTRAALETGRYHGIGELHLIGGFAPKPDAMHVLKALMQLAAEFDVPIMLHNRVFPTGCHAAIVRAFSGYTYPVGACRGHPGAAASEAGAGGL
jgi:Tat protein secretion system quality control protein TatD with DNase activity